MTVTSDPGGPPPDGFDAIDFVARYAAPLFLIALVLIFALLEPRFVHPLNLFNVLRQVSISGLVAIGMTFVILTAGIDLSVGSIVALAGLVGAYVAKGGLEDRFAVGVSVEGGNPVILAFLAAVELMSFAFWLQASRSGGRAWPRARVRDRAQAFLTNRGTSAFRTS